MGPQTKHEIHLCLKHTLHAYSKGSYMHLVIVCMNQFLVWSSPFVVFWQSVYLKVQDFRFSYLMQLYFSLSLAGHQNWDTFVWWWGGDHMPGTQLRCVDHLPSPGTGRGRGQVGSLHKEQKAKHQYPVLCLALLQFYGGGQWCLSRASDMPTVK